MNHAQPDERPVVLITGVSGLIGSRIADALVDRYAVAGLDLVSPPNLPVGATWAKCDLTDDGSVEEALEVVNELYGDRLASVIHLAAYYDFSGEPSPLYHDLTVAGTRRLLTALRAKFTVEQFVFSSSLLVMESAEGDRPVTEVSPVDAEWDYPKSKLAAELIIREEHGDTPAVILRIAGVYDEDGHSVPISQQIRRIYEKELESYFFPGDKTHGQAFVHLEDLTELFVRTVEQRDSLGEYEVFLVGEEEVMSYEELQEQIGKQIHGKEWPAIRIPKAVAKAGAWVKEKMADDEAAFIKPWMIDLADQNYPVDILRARTQFGWQPKHTLRKTLPVMIARLLDNPRRWYEENKLPLPDDLKAQEPSTKETEASQT